MNNGLILLILQNYDTGIQCSTINKSIFVDALNCEPTNFLWCMLRTVATVVVLCPVIIVQEARTYCTTSYTSAPTGAIAYCDTESWKK